MHAVSTLSLPVASDRGAASALLRLRWLRLCCILMCQRLSGLGWLLLNALRSLLRSGSTATVLCWLVYLSCVLLLLLVVVRQAKYRVECTHVRGVLFSLLLYHSNRLSKYST